MLLAIDVGNTNTVLGIFEDEHLLHQWRITSDASKTVDEYAVLIHDLFRLVNIHFYDITGIAISSVVPPLSLHLEEVSRTYFKRKPLVISAAIETGMPVLYDNPHEVGADRIVNAVAAYELFPRSLIVIDFGTATTFDYVTAAGEYAGGAIAPGMGISLNALTSKTSKLPRIDFGRPARAIGRTTLQSMQSGIFYGYASLVDGIVEQMRQESGEHPMIVATGGLGPLIAPATKSIEEVVPTLTLDGMRIIYQRTCG